MFLRCQHRINDGKHACNEFAKSAWYQVDQSLTPEYEWYKPESTKGLKGDLRQHVEMGGLIIRKKKQ